MKAKNIAVVGLVTIMAFVAVWPVFAEVWIDAGQGKVPLRRIPLSKEVIENKELFSHVLGTDTFVATEKGSLSGIEGVCVRVEAVREDMKQYITAEEVKSDVELLLRKRGIKVLPEDQIRRTHGQPYLYVNINVVPSDRYHRAINVRRMVSSISVELKQNVRLVRDFRVTMQDVATWKQETLLLIDSLGFRRRCKYSVETFANEFIKDYLAANPKEPTTKKPEVKQDNK